MRIEVTEERSESVRAKRGGTLKLEVGRTYRTRCGNKARVIGTGLEGSASAPSGRPPRKGKEDFAVKHSDGIHLWHFEDGRANVFDDEHGLVAPWEEEEEMPTKESELGELVRKANEGLAALVKIENDFTEKCELTKSPGSTDFFTVGSACIYQAGDVIRIKKAPAFEPFKLKDSGHKVTVAESAISAVFVGCQSFDLVWLRTGLRGLCKDGVTQSDGTNPLVATRTGVRRLGSEITWADADQLLAALEKVKV